MCFNFLAAYKFVYNINYSYRAVLRLGDWDCNIILSVSAHIILVTMVRKIYLRIFFSLRFPTYTYVTSDSTRFYVDSRLRRQQICVDV